MAASNATDHRISAYNFPKRGEENFHNIWQKVRGILLTLDALLAYHSDSSAGHSNCCIVSKNKSIDLNSYCCEDYDWIFISGDDTYAHMDNIRQLLDSDIIQSKLGHDHRNPQPLFIGQVS
jgi:hypothetical protein